MKRIIFFFFNDTATTEIYTLSLHDALPIFLPAFAGIFGVQAGFAQFFGGTSLLILVGVVDRKSTRLNSSHANISYAVFCLKKKNTTLLLSHPILSLYLHPLLFYTCLSHLYS